MRQENSQSPLTKQEKLTLGELLRTGSEFRELIKRVFDYEAAGLHVRASQYAQEVSPHTGTFRNAEATDAAVTAFAYENAMNLLDRATKD